MDTRTTKTETEKFEFLNEDLSKKLGIYTRVENITPEIARKYLLRRRPEQRKISPSTVQRYINDLTAGAWQMNGETIVFAKDGSLLNGNHRLTAIIRSNQAMVTLVVYGIANDVGVYDVQKKRTAKDISQINNIELSPTALTAAKHLIGMFKPFGDGVLNKYIKEHQSDLRRAYNACCKGEHGRSGKKASCVLACYLMLRTKNAQYHELEMFFDVYNNKNLMAGDGYVTSPPIMARETIENMDPRQPRRSRYQLEILVQALEDFLSGTEREAPYTISDDMHWEKYAKQVRKEDGLSYDDDN